MNVAVDFRVDFRATAEAVFGDRHELAEQYVSLLAGPGMTRGLIGPGEADRLWDRHMFNSAVLGELLPEGARVLDVGSGAGLPGIPLALARPDLAITLLEPMERRVAWLREVIGQLGLPVSVHRGRADDPEVRDELGGTDVVTARAVAPLGRLAGWCLPLVASGGRLLAIKGASAHDEASRDALAVRKAGGGAVEIVECGESVVRPPTTVVVVFRRAQRVSRPMSARRRKDR
ncbi:MAG TPA: 16S rRNA (guanine(527)-N(7))-methyltransferase RsmG [Pseudonocardiaceae bacterium]